MFPLKKMSFPGNLLSNDVLSELHQYMTALELYYRKNLNPLWYRMYLAVLPKWATSIEPWFIAARTGDMQLLDDLLSVSNVPQHDYVTIFDGLPYENNIYGVIQLALLNGHLLIALKLARKYEDEIEENSTLLADLAMFDDHFLKLYVEDIRNTVYDLVDDFKKTIRVLTRALSKGYINQEWLTKVVQEIMVGTTIPWILTAYYLLNVEMFGPSVEPFSDLITDRYQDVVECSQRRLSRYR